MDPPSPAFGMPMFGEGSRPAAEEIQPLMNKNPMLGDAA